MATTDSLERRAPVAGRPPRRRRVPTPVLLIAPSIVFMTLLFVWPLVVGVGQAMWDDGFTTAHLRRMLENRYFWQAARNTGLLVLVLIPAQFVLAVGMALLVRARPRWLGFHLYVWVVPLAVSDLAAGLVWLSIFTDRGYLNSTLEHLGLPTYAWLSYQHPTTVFLAVVVAELWRSTSLVFVIVVAGMQQIPRDYDEAAAVFGASYWQRLRHVILPQLLPSLQVALVLRTILALETFAVARALTGREFPLLVGEAYEWYDNLRNPPVAAAIALVVLTLSLLAAMGYFRLLRVREWRAPDETVEPTAPAGDLGPAGVRGDHPVHGGTALPDRARHLDESGVAQPVPAAAGARPTCRSRRCPGSFRPPVWCRRSSTRSRSVWARCCWCSSIGLPGRLRASTVCLPRARSRTSCSCC